MAYVKALAATRSNVNISSPGFTTLDGVLLSSGSSRILLTKQSTTSQNGIWIFNGSGNPLSRPTATGDQYATTAALDNATVVWVTEGNTLAGTVWGIDPAKRVTVDTTPHELTRVSLPPVQCRCATTEDISIGGTHTTIDGVTLVGDGGPTSDIVLVKDQATRSQNGVYWANTTGAMARCTEPLPPGRAVVVGEGERNAHTRYQLATTGAVVLGTTDLNFALQSEVYNVRDFGAVGDGSTDDAPAIMAALGAMSPDTRGGVLFFPPGTYHCESDIDITKQVVVKGVSGGANQSLSKLDFAGGKQLVLWNLGSALGGIGQGTSVCDLEIGTSQVPALDKWQASEVCDVGDKRYVEGINHAYLECIQATGAKEAGLTPPTVDYQGDDSDWFAPSTPYFYGQLVRGRDGGGALIDSTLFMVTTPAALAPSALSGGAEPAWNLAGTTTSGGVTFTPVGPRSIVTDNDLVWAVKTHSGIWMKTRARCQNLFIQGATNAGITIRANADIVRDNANSWSLVSCSIDVCGMGVFASGGNANAGVGMLLNVERPGGLDGNGGHGIHDASQLGSTWIGCLVTASTATGGGRCYLKTGAGYSTFINPYSEVVEGPGPLVECSFEPPCFVIGGNFGSGIAKPVQCTLLDAGDVLGCMNVKGRTLTADDKILAAILGYQPDSAPGTSNGSTALVWQHSDDASLSAISASAYLAGLPDDWWTFGRIANQLEQAFAIPRPGQGTFPVGGAALIAGESALWVTQQRVHVGDPLSGANPSCLGFGEGPPDPEDERYFARGSVLFNTLADVDTTMGWICIEEGTPGTWSEMPKLPVP